MLAHDRRGSARRPLEAPDPDDIVKADVNALLTILGPLLLATSRAADGPDPRDALEPIRLIARHTLSLVLRHL